MIGEGPAKHEPVKKKNHTTDEDKTRDQSLIAGSIPVHGMVCLQSCHYDFVSHEPVGQLQCSHDGCVLLKQVCQDDSVTS